MGKNDPALLPGTLEVLVLRVLARGPAHGFGIAQAIHLLSSEVLRVEEGSLYPALHRLEARGLVAAEWGVSENNRRARFYKLTAAGRRELRHGEAEFRRVAGAVLRVLEEA